MRSTSSLRESRLGFCLGVDGPARELLPKDRMDSLSELALAASEAEARIEDLEPRRWPAESGEATLGEWTEDVSAPPGVVPEAKRRPLL